jgi:ParB family chromosome partitioning protein
LLDEGDLAEAGPPEAVRLPLDLVDPNPQNPRRELAEVDALAENIKTFGLLQPVTVRRVGKRYELLGGHRRHAAFQLLREQHPEDVQWRSIPAVVRTADDDRSYLMLLSGQLHNRTWRPREEAAALERLVTSGRNLKQIGEALNRTESWASKRLRVYADAVLSAYVQTGRLAAGVAEELLPILDAPTRKDFADRAVKQKWSQDRARGEVRSLRLDKQLREIARRARELLEILSSVDPTRLTPAMTRDLWTLRGRIDAIGRGGPVMPSIEQAQRAAGVRTQERAQRGRRKTGYRPRS